jgi:hypothetical protein
MPSGSAHFFSYSPSTGRLNNLGGGNNNGEMGDDIFQFFTPPPPPPPPPPPRNNTAEDGRERPPTSDGSPSPLGNFVQNLLTNMLGQNVDITTTVQSNDGEGGGGIDGNGQDGRPMVFFGNMVDGNVRLQPMPAGQTMPGGMPNLAAAAAAAAAANAANANTGERNEDGENTNRGTENNNGNEDPRGNNIARFAEYVYQIMQILI